jgi:hypothetical protein
VTCNRCRNGCLLQQLEEGKSETLTAYLAAMARCHNYSFGNIMSIARQRPTATRSARAALWSVSDSPGQSFDRTDTAELPWLNP